MGILEEEWVIVFRAEGSEFVWCLWPVRASVGEGTGEGTEEGVVWYFERLVARGLLRVEREMEVGGGRWERYLGVVRQALWADGVSDFLGADWRSGEFGGRF